MKTIQNQKRRKIMNNDKLKQVGGNHYEVLEIQPVELFFRLQLPWHKAEPIKYLSRFPNKNGYQDLLKCIHILRLAIEVTKDLSDTEVPMVYHYETPMLPDDMFINKYIDQFKTGFFLEPTSWNIFVKCIMNILNNRYKNAIEQIELLIYSEYESFHFN